MDGRLDGHHGWEERVCVKVWEREKKQRDDVGRSAVRRPNLNCRNNQNRLLSGLYSLCTALRTADEGMERYPMSSTATIPVVFTSGRSALAEKRLPRQARCYGACHGHPRALAYANTALPAILRNIVPARDFLKRHAFRVQILRHVCLIRDEQDRVSLA